MSRAERIRELMEDEGMSRAEARAWYENFEAELTPERKHLSECHQHCCYCGPAVRRARDPRA